MGLFNMRLMAFDCQVSRLAVMAAEEGFISQENREDFLEEASRILKTSGDNIQVIGPEELQEKGELMEIKVKIKDVVAVDNPGFWNMEGNGSVSRQTERYVYSRGQEDVDEVEDGGKEEKP